MDHEIFEPTIKTTIATKMGSTTIKTTIATEMGIDNDQDDGKRHRNNDGM